MGARSLVRHKKNRQKNNEKMIENVRDKESWRERERGKPRDVQNRHALLRIVHGWMSSRFRCNDGLCYPLSVALSPLGGVAAHFVVIIFTNSVKQVGDVIISGWLVCAVVMVTVGSGR